MDFRCVYISLFEFVCQCSYSHHIHISLSPSPKIINVNIFRQVRIKFKLCVPNRMSTSDKQFHLILSLSLPIFHFHRAYTDFHICSLCLFICLLSATLANFSVQVHWFANFSVKRLCNSIRSSILSVLFFFSLRSVHGCLFVSFVRFVYFEIPMSILYSNFTIVMWYSLGAARHFRPHACAPNCLLILCIYALTDKTTMPAHIRLYTREFQFVSHNVCELFDLQHQNP